MKHVFLGMVIVALSAGTAPLSAQDRLAQQKAEAVKGVDEMAKLAQEMVDSVFSFGELGMQEVETSRYLTAQLEKYGFKVTRGQSGMPTAWVATYGSGKPVIALGSDIDGIPQSSQKPGVAYHDPIVEGAPGSADYGAFYAAAAEKGWIFSDPRAARAQPGQAKALASMYEQIAATGGIAYETDIEMKFSGSGPLAAVMARMGGTGITTSVTNVETGPLADDLFVPPADYKLNTER